MNKLLIIGCGWLGLPLAKHLATKGWRVRGTTTTEAKKPDLQQAGIESFIFKITEDGFAGEYFLDNWPRDAFILINIPPSRQRKEGQSYLTQMQQLRQLLLDWTPNPKVIFVSSTSVYNTDTNPLNVPLTEQADVATDTETHKAEQVFADLPHTIILRMSGLAGYNRVIGRYFAGKQNIADGQAKVNLVHRDDAVAIIEQIVIQNPASGIYNVTAPCHPSRRSLFLADAAKHRFDPPSFSKQDNRFRKLIDGSKITEQIDYHFLYPDPLQFPVD